MDVQNNTQTLGALVTPQGYLQRYFGFAVFRQGQEEVIEALLTEGRALAVFPTGGGKSICYQVPALLFEGLTVVVSPLIALMKDQIDFLVSHEIAAARLDSTLTSDESRQITSKINDRSLKLLYVAPERLNNERFLSLMTRTRIALLAIDEAHCISEWGHNFRPDYLKISQIAQDIKAERILALTATATPPVVEDICRAFAIPKRAAIVTGFYRENLNLCLTPVDSAKRDDLLAKRLTTRKLGATIVYVTLQKTAEQVAERLRARGFPAEAYHAGMDDAVRAGVQDRWMKASDGIIVATIAFGMGIDKSDVRYVYHYNLPKSLEGYSQEIGRAGRDGIKSTVELLACPEDLPTLENFFYGDTPALRSLQGMLEELFSLGEEFDISLYEISNAFDIRLLVLRTALTYLELEGVLRQGTPFYSAYEVQLLRPMEQIAHEFKGRHRQFVLDIFRHSRFGNKWHHLDPDQVAAALQTERRRVARALEYLEEQGWAVLRLANIRNRYTRTAKNPDVAALAESLYARFTERETREQERLEMITTLVTSDSCQSNALVAYFGELRTEPCGRCTRCLTGKAAILPPLRAAAAIEELLDQPSWRALRRAHSAALQEDRQAARFLAGLSSPALAKAKLTKHALFGALEQVRYGTVLEWLAQNN